MTLHTGTAVAMTLLTACASAPPEVGDPGGTAVVGGNGKQVSNRSGDLRDELAASAPDPDAFGELYDTVAGLSDTPVYVDNHVELLIDGPATYARMLEAIDRARSIICLETYIFSDDDVGRRFAESLVQKRRDGVNVFVIFDSLGSAGSSDGFFEQMRDAGIDVVEYHDVNPLDGGNPLDLNVRDHRKLLIVDGKIAFTGGINLTSTYTSSSGHSAPERRLEDGWRDTHVAIRGPAAAGFEAVFRANWTAQDGPVLPAADATAVPAAGNDVVAVLTAVGGDENQSAIFHAYKEAIGVARTRVWITQAYFAPDGDFLDDLEAAATSGIDVRIIVPGVSDSSLVLSASRSRYGRLLRAGVRIYENQEAVLHAKTAVVDGLWSTVGSSNLDSRSFLHNDEVNAVIFGRNFADQLESQFIDDMEESRQITLADWNDRGFWQRVREWASWPLEYWL